MKLAFIHAHPSKRFSAWLTKIFTGSTAYHCGFVDEAEGTFFDMHLLPRKVDWPRYQKQGYWVELYDIPGLSREMCEKFLQRDSIYKYDFVDYFLFALRPIYHFFGKSTRGAKGLICSRMCGKWAKDAGYDAPFDPSPSPGDLERWAMIHLAKSIP